MKKIIKLKVVWICITAVLFVEAFLTPQRAARAVFGESIPVLMQILMQAYQQVKSLKELVGNAKETIGLLEEMNRGVKEVLRIAETAHIPLPPQVYAQAKEIDQAVNEARKLYGQLPSSTPQFAKNNYHSGIEGLFLSQDTFEYSTFLDEQGKRIKEAAIFSSPQAATRLTAESMGVLLHAVNHSNRLEAKNLEINSSNRIEEAAKESAKQQSFLNTYNSIERKMNSNDFTPLNSFGKEELP